MALAFNIPIDKDVVRGILAHHYRLARAAMMRNNAHGVESHQLLSDLYSVFNKAATVAQSTHSVKTT
jgi:hypothetical protein